MSPDNIPLEIEADISALTLDNRISIGDLTLPAGATTLVPENISVAAAVISRVAQTVAEEDELEAAEGEEGEEGEGSEGEGGADAEGSGADAENE